MRGRSAPRWRRAQERGLLAEGLQFLGWRLDVPFLLRQANIFLLTSENEGFPNVLLEAMAARLPVVTTPAGDSGRVVTDGMTGYVVDQGDLVGMAQRVLQLAGRLGCNDGWVMPGAGT